MNFSNITWLDEKGHIKPPIFLYLILVFLARGWCVFIASLTQFNDRAGLVRLFYPEKSDFLMALMAGVGAVIIYGLIIAERKRAPQLARPFFNKIKYGIWLLLIVDAIILNQRLVHDDFLFRVSFALDALFIFWSAIYLLKSKRLHYYFKDWQNETDYLNAEQHHQKDSNTELIEKTLDAHQAKQYNRPKNPSAIEQTHEKN
ncbi:hypothetical protein SJ2017_2616 [Shewanella japonica]|uniref:DUF2919 domain-containing protein n=1 Tax=Shewanella japonica TaxID=93973 RepID=A0ABM6JM55_9GAMM|nr:hypothetical protein SJ2017_2616 [Shewanella japonica]